MTQLLFYLATLNDQRASRQRPIFGAKSEAWRYRMFHIFHFLQSNMGFGIVTPFSGIFNAISSEKSCLASMPFLLKLTLASEQSSFSLLQKPDWSIQISGTPAVCKDRYPISKTCAVNPPLPISTGKLLETK